VTRIVASDEEDSVPESFETAVPVQRVAVSMNGTTDPESYVIGCCILDEGETLDKAMASELHASDFRSPSLSLIYGTLSAMRGDKEAIDLSTLYERLGSRADSVGGIQALMAMADPITIGTTARASHYIGRLLQESANRRAVNRARALIEAADKGEDVVEIRPPTRTLAQRLPSSFLLTPDDDASVLLGNRFLNRGDGGILVGSSGMGKSSAAIQMSVSWALGLPFMGIKSNGCLRILIIQSEDSDGDIAEVMLSMRHMLKLTQAQIDQVDQNVRIVCDRVNRGNPFIIALKKHIEEFNPDLIIINPLQAFIDGDVTESRDLGKFLREGLNGLNDSKFGFILVHHTTKPSTGKDKSERQWHEVMYDMAGGAELINWARFVVSLRAAKTNTVGDFDLVLAKRGRRANVTVITGEVPFIKEEIITSIPVRHATGSIDVPGRRKPVAVIFWEPREISEKEKPSKPNTGAPEKFPFSQYSNVFPSKIEKPLPYSQLKSRLDTNGPIPKGSFSNLLKKWEHATDIERIMIEGQPTLYRKTV
jgi:hypothetical protein